MRRRVMLHLLTGQEVVLARRTRWLVSDAAAPAVGGERLVRERRAPGDELLVHAHQVAFAPGEEIDDLLVVRLGLLGSRR